MKSIVNFFRSMFNIRTNPAVGQLTIGELSKIALIPPDSLKTEVSPVKKRQPRKQTANKKTKTAPAALVKRTKQ